MDIFNRKRIKYLEEQLQLSSIKESRANRVIQVLVQDPDSDLGIAIKTLLIEKYNKNFWSRLTRESHLGYLYNKEHIDKISKQLIEYI